MEILKKILFVISSLLILIFIFLIYWYYHDGKLGKGDYFIYDTGFHTIKSFKNKKLYIGDILKSKYNDNYIIAIRVPVKIFYGEKNCHSFFENTLHYLLINKETDKIYETDDYLKFKYKLKNSNINLMFNNQELEQAKKKFQKNKHLYTNMKTLEYLKNNCTEDFRYPIEKF